MEAMGGGGHCVCIIFDQRGMWYNMVWLLLFLCAVECSSIMVVMVKLIIDPYTKRCRLGGGVL
jgi:hypothetical protein